MCVKWLTELESSDSQWEIIRKYMSEYRLEKLDRIHTLGMKAACAGAGLLLQWAYNEWMRNSQEKISDVRSEDDASRNCGHVTEENICKIESVSYEDILANINTPYKFEVQIDESTKGKPYIKSRPFYYNLSHSGDYVICAVSDCEIGVDIQKMSNGIGVKSRVDYKNIGNTKAAKAKNTRKSTADRFFAEEEKNMLASIHDETERNLLFYRLWSRKEALGKLTGMGVAPCLDTNLLDISKGIAGEYIWEEYDVLRSYMIVCCRQSPD
jgi:phosphopantetheinyl transferase (holo-ACP synthase)